MGCRILLAFLWVFALLASSGVASAGGVTTYYHTDHLGSPVAATNDFGEVSWEESYKPFGDRIHNELAAFESDIWYTGKEHDWETGLTYMNARYYDPAIGRFMAIDPVGSLPGKPQTFNRYSYANNNPYRFVDPDGRSAVTAFGGLLYESGQAIAGNGFDWASVGGALVDGYNGEGAGVGSAVFEDVTTFVPVGALLGAAAKLSKLVRATKGADETVDLYRAVSSAEFDDIVKSGQFNLGPSAFGKQFGFGFDEILQLSDHLPDTAAIIKAKVPKSALNGLDHTPVDRHILRNGSLTVQPEKLDQFNSAVQSIEHVF